MRRTTCTLLALLLSASAAHAQIGVPGVEYSTAIAAGEGGQLYPYDQQDPWLHGQFQRVPAYGGFSSFRPYNYRHVFSQTQIASGWGSPHGMPYSQQFWNKYRGSYLNGNLHTDVTASTQRSVMPGSQPVSQTSYAQPVAPAAHTDVQPLTNFSTDQRPVHIFPPGMPPRQ